MCTSVLGIKCQMHCNPIEVFAQSCMFPIFSANATIHGNMIIHIFVDGVLQVVYAIQNRENDGGKCFWRLIFVSIAFFACSCNWTSNLKMACDYIIHIFCSFEQSKVKLSCISCYSSGTRLYCS